LNPDPDPLVRGTDPEIRIRTKMSRIPNTAIKGVVFNTCHVGSVLDSHWFQCTSGSSILGQSIRSRVLMTKKFQNSTADQSYKRMGK
jgi:hypothetical protein